MPSVRLSIKFLNESASFIHMLPNLQRHMPNETTNLDDTFEDDLVELLDTFDEKHKSQEDLLKEQVGASIVSFLLSFFGRKLSSDSEFLLYG